MCPTDRRNATSVASTASGSDDGERVTPPSEIWRELQKAAELVATWPEWEQRAAGVKVRSGSA